MLSGGGNVVRRMGTQQQMISVVALREVQYEITSNFPT